MRFLCAMTIFPRLINKYEIIGTLKILLDPHPIIIIYALNYYKKTKEKAAL